jgi:HK97 gp10 family phage protein
VQLKYSITGVKEMTRNLLNVGRAMATSGSDAALIASAERVKAEAKRLVPKRTGALQRAIDRTNPSGKPGGRQIAVGVKRPQSRYAHFIEFGTENHGAQPYLRPALDITNAPNQGLMARVLGRFMNRGVTPTAITKTGLSRGID